MNYISKWRYLKITSGRMIWGTDNLTKEDLLRVRSGAYETILNLEQMTYYDAESKEWKDINGDKF